MRRHGANPGRNAWLESREDRPGTRHSVSLQLWPWTRAMDRTLSAEAFAFSPCGNLPSLHRPFLAARRRRVDPPAAARGRQDTPAAGAGSAVIAARHAPEVKSGHHTTNTTQEGSELCSMRARAPRLVPMMIGAPSGTQAGRAPPPAAGLADRRRRRRRRRNHTAPIGPPPVRAASAPAGSPTAKRTWLARHGRTRSRSSTSAVFR